MIDKLEPLTWHVAQALEDPPSVGQYPLTSTR